MNSIKCEVLSDLENGIINRMVAAQESGTQAAQTTNSRYVAAMSVVIDYLQDQAFSHSIGGLVIFINHRLNAEKDPHCT